MDNSTKSFFSGLFTGLAVGAVAGILLAPKSGEETRGDIKKFAVDMSDKATDKYEEIKKEVERRLNEVKKAGKKIDWDAYKNMVNKVLNEFKEDGQVTVEIAEKMGTQLGRDWDMVKASFK
ncbi:MAG: YtxH domain-containing protein [Candidatus Dojkabacteria bacterium]|jgi:gas vesicle protein|nr:YtxH domain-containing protein [Candidatus Dojkabacteria bacterium]MDD2270135.1 YtxH domain-containing protein [Candidatus Dojkabacteria bacterium]